MAKTALNYKPYQLKSRWYNRLQTAQECVTDLVRFLQGLEQFEPPFTPWRYANPKLKLEPIPSDLDEIRKRVLEPRDGGRRGYTKPEATIPTYGFLAMLFSEGKVRERICIEINCGLTEKYPN